MAPDGAWCWRCWRRQCGAARCLRRERGSGRPEAALASPARAPGAPGGPFQARAGFSLENHSRPTDDVYRSIRRRAAGTPAGCMLHVVCHPPAAAAVAAAPTELLQHAAASRAQNDLLRSSYPPAVRVGWRRAFISLGRAGQRSQCGTEGWADVVIAAALPAQPAYLGSAPEAPKHAGAEAGGNE